MWQAECYYCLRNNLDLQSTILYLKRIERPIPLLQTEPSIAASATHKHRDGRSKDKRKEKEREPRPRSKRPRSPSLPHLVHDRLRYLLLLGTQDPRCNATFVRNESMCNRSAKNTRKQRAACVRRKRAKMTKTKTRTRAN
jgi:hypothetical protein